MEEHTRAPIIQAKELTPEQFEEAARMMGVVNNRVVGTTPTPPTPERVEKGQHALDHLMALGKRAAKELVDQHAANQIQTVPQAVMAIRQLFEQWRVYKDVITTSFLP